MSNKLNELRAEINNIDEEILMLLSKRFSLMPEIAKEKLSLIKEVYDQNRENEMIEKRYAILRDEGFDDINFIRDLFGIIMNKSKQIQKDFILKN